MCLCGFYFNLLSLVSVTAVSCISNKTFLLKVLLPTLLSQEEKGKVDHGAALACLLNYDVLISLS